MITTFHVFHRYKPLYLDFYFILISIYIFFKLEDSAPGRVEILGFELPGRVGVSGNVKFHTNDFKWKISEGRFFRGGGGVTAVLAPTKGLVNIKFS